MLMPTPMSVLTRGSHGRDGDGRLAGSAPNVRQASSETRRAS
jgi:hypothetical protein